MKDPMTEEQVVETIKTAHVATTFITMPDGEEPMVLILAEDPEDPTKESSVVMTLNSLKQVMAQADEAVNNAAKEESK